MTHFSRQELSRLMSVHQPPCVSVYFPVVRKDDTAQNAIRFKNLLRNVQPELHAHGLSPSEINEFLKRTESLLRDELFWDRLGEGCAAFLSRDLFEVYSLPFAVAENAIVNTRFHVKALLPLLSEDARFFVVAVSRSRARLFDATAHRLLEVALPGLPQGIDEALVLRVDQNTARTRASSVSRMGSRMPQAGGVATVHGKEVDKIDKADLKRYFAIVDRAVMTALKDQHAPLVVAAVDYEIPIYRDANSYPHLLDIAVEGSPDGWTLAELHARAWSEVRPWFEKRSRGALEAFRARRGTPRVSTDLADILKAVHDGRVQTLFLARNRAAWGHYDPPERRAQIHRTRQPGDEDLLDLVGVKALDTGSQVQELSTEEMPDGSTVAALYRY